MVRRTIRSGLPRDKIMDVLRTMKAYRTEPFKIEQIVPVREPLGRMAREIQPQIDDMELLLRARMDRF